MASTEMIEAFLAEPRNVVLAGIRRDGRPHLSPNWFYWDGQRFYVSTTRSRAGPAGHQSRHPAVGLDGVGPGLAS
jgi:nitroimidazol reductase NimA-like FMN-containing flavoprotein (pyridoxamine 5'-phosphate oxidase superfamily)